MPPTSASHRLAPVDVECVAGAAKHQPGLAWRRASAVPATKMRWPAASRRDRPRPTSVAFWRIDGGRGKVLLDERGPRGSAADGFEPQGAGAGEQIDGVLADDVGTDQVEDRLADTVFHRPRAVLRHGVDQSPAAQRSANDARRAGRLVGRGRRSPAGPVSSFVVLACHALRTSQHPGNRAGSCRTSDAFVTAGRAADFSLRLGLTFRFPTAAGASAMLNDSRTRASPTPGPAAILAENVGFFHALRHFVVLGCLTFCGSVARSPHREKNRKRRQPACYARRRFCPELNSRSSRTRGPA